ncbi:MAG TPA: NB-ARC domain-containing protein, partial [Chloroflexota bacterium]|nr:NB-ARC domain-containing protein [Chloroflexota bacterium]
MNRDDPSPRSVAREAAIGEAEGRRATFARQVRDALAHLYDPLYLQTHPLARLVAPDRDPRAPGVGKALRQVLLDAIDALHPLTGSRGTLPSGVGYQILHLRYVEGLEVSAIQDQLALGKSEFYREQQRGVDAVVSLLWDRWRDNGSSAATSAAPSAVSVEDAPPVSPRPRHNLPTSTTTYISRAGELAQVSQRLAETRLLTLTGSGGCGKTRLAIEIARDCVDEFADGVWLVELAPLADPSLVPQAIATALDLRESADRPLLTTLADFLRNRQTLLVLDNCEHLIDACARVVDTLLHACPRLRILATSRELLGIAGEATWRVPSLAVADPGDAGMDRENLVAGVLQSEAGRLFADRARLVLPSFSVTSENAPAVAQVCQRLDGIPLAIELAAARVAVLSVDQIAARLDQRFRLLTGGNRTALRRQQTLRATIDWSYQLLSDDERTLLRRLAVFAGGWTLEAAEAVGAASAADGGAFEVLDLLTLLAAKSLVQAEEPAAGGRGNRRFRLSETMRQYAEEKLL